jgi:ABC-2 type transport system ATP-binding protein
LISAVAARAEVHDLAVVEPEIDDVVRRLYARRHAGRSVGNVGVPHDSR